MNRWKRFVCRFKGPLMASQDPFQRPDQRYQGSVEGYSPALYTMRTGEDIVSGWDQTTIPDQGHDHCAWEDGALRCHHRDMDHRRVVYPKKDGQVGYTALECLEPKCKCPGFVKKPPNGSL